MPGSYANRRALTDGTGVRALVGFTRMMSSRDFDNAADLPSVNRERISRKDPTWLPACETRGEGIFFQFSDEQEFDGGYQLWRISKNLDPNKGYPGIRYTDPRLLDTAAVAP